METSIRGVVGGVGGSIVVVGHSIGLWDTGILSLVAIDSAGGRSIDHADVDI